jgi:hypothetical protein
MSSDSESILYLDNDDNDSYSSVIILNNEECEESDNKFHCENNDMFIEKTQTTNNSTQDVDNNNLNNEKSIPLEKKKEVQKIDSPKEKFKILEEKPKRYTENDSKLKRNVTMFKKKIIGEINKNLNKNGLKELKLVDTINLGQSKTEIWQNFNKSFNDIFNDEKNIKYLEFYNKIYEKLKQINNSDSKKILEILNEKILIIYETLYLDLIEDHDGLNKNLNKYSNNFEKFNFEKFVCETMSKDNKKNLKDDELKKYLKDFKKFAFNYVNYLKVENKYQLNQQLQKKRKRK